MEARKLSRYHYSSALSKYGSLGVGASDFLLYRLHKIKITDS
jgi:hypothetical protein